MHTNSLGSSPSSGYYAGLGALLDSRLGISTTSQVAQSSLGPRAGESKRSYSTPQVEQQESKERESKRSAAEDGSKPNSMLPIASRGFSTFVSGAPTPHVCISALVQPSGPHLDLTNQVRVPAVTNTITLLPFQSAEVRKVEENANKALLNLAYQEPTQQEIAQFFNTHPDIDLGTLDLNGKTILNRALYASCPSKLLITELLNRNAPYRPGVLNVPVSVVKNLFDEHNSPGDGIVALMKAAKNAKAIKKCVRTIAYSELNGPTSRMACSYIIELNEELDLYHKKVLLDVFASMGAMQEPEKIIRAYLLDLDLPLRLAKMRAEEGLD